MGLVLRIYQGKKILGTCCIDGDDLPGEVDIPVIVDGTAEMMTVQQLDGVIISYGINRTQTEEEKKAGEPVKNGWPVKAGGSFRVNASAMSKRASAIFDDLKSIVSAIPAPKISGTVAVIPKRKKSK
jgi:hypothetical protein